MSAGTESAFTFDGPNISPSFEDLQDGAVFGDFTNIDDEPLFEQDGGLWKFEDTPPYDTATNLYSTPLAWDAPKVHPQASLKVETVAPASTTVSLTPAQQELLRSIAMPEHLQYPNSNSSLGHSPESQGSSMGRTGSVSSPDHADHGRKRKSTSEERDEDDDHHDDSGSQRPVKKTAHNMIEKRYRTNLNDKIAALRDSVPSLRVMAKSARGEDGEKEDLEGLTPAHKLNKATVLAKATEYIRHLEKRTKRLAEDNASMKARIAAFEKLFLSGSMGMNSGPAPVNQFNYGQEQQWTGAAQMNGQITPSVSPRGMVDIPEEYRRMSQQPQHMQQQTYQMPANAYPQNMNRAQGGTNAWSNTGGYFGKVMVGSLAGLMIMEGFSETQASADAGSERELSALPVHLIGGLARWIKVSAEFNFHGYHFSSAQTFAYLRLFLMLGALLYVFVPSFFVKHEKPKGEKVAASSSSIEAAPSLASPIQVRRQAWLTAIQTVWVPNHNFVLEATALALKMLKLSIRNVIGVYGYTLLTGTTEPQEAARIKAWSIAIDAQLSGGDVEVSKSRLMLTLMASGTLPDTPARLMLKALHIRVILWELGHGNFTGSTFFNNLAVKLARWKWMEARHYQQLLTHSHAGSPSADFEPLPDHLAALLNQDADEVLSDRIVQRAYNLTYNLPATENIAEKLDGMDNIVDDHSIRSPLDAVAAWFSSLTLHQALEESLDPNLDTPAAKTARTRDISIAIDTAPLASETRIRALIARAVLSDQNRGANISAAMQEYTVLAPPSPVIDGSATATQNVPTLIVTPPTTSSVTPDFMLAISCAKAIAHLNRSAHIVQASAYPIIKALEPSVTGLSLLSFTACYKLLDAILNRVEASRECGGALENLAGTLRIWVGSEQGQGLQKEIKELVVERCISVTKKAMGMDEIDAGYESMEDDGLGC